MNPIGTEYSPYFLTQRIEELRRLAISSKATDMLRTMRELMGAVGCRAVSDGKITTTSRKIVEFVQMNCQLHKIGHLPPVTVDSILTAWIKTEPEILVVPAWDADELYLFGWLIVFALHEDYAPVDAWVEFSQYREEFVIHGVKWIEN